MKTIYPRYSHFAAIVLLVAFSARLNAATIDVARCGATYGNQSTAAGMAANDAAMSKAIAQVTAANGGTILVSDLLLLSKPIAWPIVPSFYGQTNVIAPMTIVGNHSNSRILWPATMGGFGITFTAPKQNSSIAPYGDWRCGLRGLSLCGAGVKISGGGKYFAIDDVSIIGVNQPGTYALDVDTYDGGHLMNINIHDCTGTGGFRIVNSHLLDVNITSRMNQTGGVITDCSSLRGRLYCESNKGLGMDWQRTGRSDITWWLENNGGSPFQGRRRDSWGNIFTGQMQSESNQAWDDDPVSRVGNDPRRVEPFSLRNVGALLAQAGALRTNYPPDQVTVNGMTVTFQPSAFGNTNPNMWVELLQTGGAPLGGSWKAGDYFVLDSVVTPDAATAQYLATQNLAAIRWATAAGIPPINQSVWMGTDGQCPALAIGKCAADGQGVRFFLYRNTTAPAPPIPLTFTVSADVRYIDNQVAWPVAPAAAAAAGGQ